VTFEIRNMIKILVIIAAAVFCYFSVAQEQYDAEEFR